MNMKLVRESLNESYIDKASQLVLRKLYSGIMNDHSIQRYSLGWSDVTDEIKKRLKEVYIDRDVQFQNSLLTDAIEIAADHNYVHLLYILRSFARELQINIDALHDKYK